MLKEQFDEEGWQPLFEMNGLHVEILSIPSLCNGYRNCHSLLNYVISNYGLSNSIYFVCYYLLCMFIRCNIVRRKIATKKKKKL